MIKKPLFLLLLLFTLTRLPNLTLLPIYADEANYLDWGWRSIQKPDHLFYSLYDAKQPLLIWIFGISEILFTDPLFAGRIVSVIAGLTCLLGIFFTTRRLFDPKSAFIASVLYILVPIFLFFDRQALMETSIASVGIWSYYFLDRFLEKPGLKKSFCLFLTLAIGVWIKNSALLFFVPFSIIILLYLKKFPQQIYSIFNYLLFGFILFLLTLSPLFFQADFWKTFSLNSRYTLGLSELFKFPISVWLKNLLGILDISFFFLTPLIFLSAVWGIIKFKTSHFYLILWLLIPLIQIILTTRTLNFRYPAAFLIPYVIFTAAVIPKKVYSYLLITCIPVIVSFIQITNPPKYFELLSRFSAYSYINDYITGDLSGYLVNAIVSYINQLDNTTPITVSFALNSGNFEAALIDYFHKNPRISTTYFDSRLFSEKLNDFDCFYYSGSQLYFFAREQQRGGMDRFLIKKDLITPLHGRDYSTVYTLRNDCPPEKTISIFLTATY